MRFAIYYFVSYIPNEKYLVELLEPPFYKKDRVKSIENKYFYIGRDKNTKSLYKNKCSKTIKNET